MALVIFLERRKSQFTPAKCELWMYIIDIAAWTWTINSDVIWYPPTKPGCFQSSFVDQYVIFQF